MSYYMLFRFGSRDLIHLERYRIDCKLRESCFLILFLILNIHTSGHWIFKKNKSDVYLLSHIKYILYYQLYSCLLI